MSQALTINELDGMTFYLENSTAVAMMDPDVFCQNLR